MNVGPTHDGRIVPLFEERLRQMGAWLGVNGEAVYASRPWTHQNDSFNPNVWSVAVLGLHSRMIPRIFLTFFVSLRSN